jgi:hypothetical protein
VEEIHLRLRYDSTYLDAQTQLVQILTTDSLPSDEATLREAIRNSSLISYFNPQNTVFEDMKSTGNLDLILDETLRYQIMEYYNYSRRVVTSQSINNELFLRYKDDAINPRFDLNSVIEPSLPAEWRAEVSPFEMTYFTQDHPAAEIEAFARQISLMKATVWINLKWKQALLEAAEEVIVAIDAYLEPQ